MISILLRNYIIALFGVTQIHYYWICSYTFFFFFRFENISICRLDWPMIGANLNCPKVADLRK